MNNKNNKIEDKARAYREECINHIEYLNNTIGHVFDTPDKDDLSSANGLHIAVSISKKIQEFVNEFGSKPSIGINEHLESSEKLRDIRDQLFLETFRKRHGFYIKTQEHLSNILVEVYSEDDTKVALAMIEGPPGKEEPVYFRGEDTEPERMEYMRVYKLSTDCSDAFIFEGGKISEDDHKLQALWDFLPKYNFVETFADLPDLVHANVNGQEVDDIKSLSGHFLMREIEKEEGLADRIGRRVMYIQDGIHPSDHYETESEMTM